VYKRQPLNLPFNRAAFPPIYPAVPVAVCDTPGGSVSAGGLGGVESRHSQNHNGSRD